MSILSSLLTEVAPTLARALGGPLAGAAVDVIAKTLGTASTEDAIVQEIQEDPALAAQHLRYLETQMQAEIARINSQGENMRLFYEAYKDDKRRGGFWSWPRPAAAWLAPAYAGAVSIVLVRDLWTRNYAIIQHLDLLIYWAVPMMALAGIWFVGRSMERSAIGKALGKPDGGDN
jgi:hypothetical protein